MDVDCSVESTGTTGATPEAVDDGGARVTRGGRPGEAEAIGRGKVETLNVAGGEGGQRRGPFPPPGRGDASPNPRTRGTEEDRRRRDRPRPESCGAGLHEGLGPPLGTKLVHLGLGEVLDRTGHGASALAPIARFHQQQIRGSEHEQNLRAGGEGGRRRRGIVAEFRGQQVVEGTGRLICEDIRLLTIQAATKDSLSSTLRAAMRTPGRARSVRASAVFGRRADRLAHHASATPLFDAAPRILASMISRP